MTKEQLYEMIKENGTRYAEDKVLCKDCPLQGSCSSDSCEECFARFYKDYEEEAKTRSWEIIISDNTPLMLNDKVVGMVVDAEVDAAGYYTCKIAKECISANAIPRDDSSYMVNFFLLQCDGKRVKGEI